MPSLFYLAITTEEERQFAIALAREYESKDRKPNWNYANNLIITNCRHKYLVTLPGSFKDITRCNPSYVCKICDLTSMKKEALKIFIMRE